MDFNLTREQTLIQKMIRAFTKNEMKPIAAETDETCRYPRESIEKLFRYGIMGMCMPKEYGGASSDDLSATLAVGELSEVCASIGDVVATHNDPCCDPILRNGTGTQEQKYLWMLTEGCKVDAFALIEPNAGSDASKGTTTAQLKGDCYVLNGSKVFITNGYVADVIMVFAMTNPSRGTRGISAFIVESSFPGYRVGKHEKKLGLHDSPTTELIFGDCIVPRENLLGRGGKGFKIAMQTLDGGRIGIATQALGITEGAIEEVVTYTKSRTQFGGPIAKFQSTQFTFADMRVVVESRRLLVHQAATLKSAGKPFTMEAVMAKLYASEDAMRYTVKALQVFGGCGCTRDFPVKRMLRDVKITKIYEGTSEVQCIMISGNTTLG